MTDSGCRNDRFRVRCDRFRVWLRRIQGRDVTKSGWWCDRFRVSRCDKIRVDSAEEDSARRYNKFRVSGILASF